MCEGFSTEVRLSHCFSSFCSSKIPDAYGLHLIGAYEVKG